MSCLTGRVFPALPRFHRFPVRPVRLIPQACVVCWFFLLLLWLLVFVGGAWVENELVFVSWTLRF